MPKHLTHAPIDKAPPAPPGKRYEIPDTDTRGLVVRVTDKGAKSYALYYYLAGRHRRYTIGPHGPITLPTARRLAREAAALVAEGIDPGQRRPQTEAEREADREATVENAVAEFMRKHAERKGRRSAPEMARQFRYDVLPAWGSQPLRSITKFDVVKLIDNVADRAPIAANRLLALLRRFFGWCVERSMIEASPCAGIKPPAEEHDRDRVLSPAELAGVWRACDQLGYPFGPAVKLLILTAQRRDEVAEATWPEFDLGEELWTIPRERAKNNEAHDVPLSAQAIELLRALPGIGDGSYLFTTTGRTPSSGWSAAKARLDRLVAERRATAGASEPMAAWRLHDLRRSAATLLAGELAIAPHVIDALLGHRTGVVKGVARVYNRARYDAERRSALAAWGQFLDDLVRSPSANVVPLRSRGNRTNG